MKKGWKLKLDKSDALLWLGAVIICTGAGMIYMPAGVIGFGIYMIFVAISEIKPGKGG